MDTGSNATGKPTEGQPESVRTHTLVLQCANSNRGVAVPYEIDSALVSGEMRGWRAADFDYSSSSIKASDA